ncbi:yippee zinc-binding/DNA-binding /Mis18, centromere assembly-domain-containing protein [Obelidium mucronatum]|nr:yippee zinc-binding/DNA-binding /Mis18, centromere assembly-domain-containing protein [Obelidium mucronatum]
MGLLHKEYLDDADDWRLRESTLSSKDRDREFCRLVVCAQCATHLTTTQDLISKAFQGSRGKAHLYNRAINICLGEPETRTMTTGIHIVRDISCKCCRSVVGWKYDKAFEESQRYKEGRFIIEVAAFKELE